MRSSLLLVTAFAGLTASISVLISAGGAGLLLSKKFQTASVFFVASITAEQMQNQYNNVSGNLTSATSSEKVRVLIVPGHQPDEGGTQFKNVYERNIVVDLADALALLLEQNSRYDVMVARTKTEWNPILQSYFDTHAPEIEAFRQSQMLQMADHIAQGSILPEADQVYHNSASSHASLQLYGINKWASDNKYDIILHLHINDYAGRRAGRVGRYDGFAVYVPDDQYSNAAASKSVAEAVAARLGAYHATSTLPKEDKGVVEDQELIAIGSNNSLDGAALLIEYGYIYEPQFLKSSVRPLAIADYAYQTYLGLQDFFEDPVPFTFGSVSFPYKWSDVQAEESDSGPGVYALQAALRYLGFYPPRGKSFSECPVSGIAGNCTQLAISEYQSALGLETTGTLGPRTRSALNNDLVLP